MSLHVDHAAWMYSNFRSRWSERDTRMDLMDSVVRGDFSTFDPSDESVENRSPNLIAVALEDTAETASLLPTIRVTPHKGTEGVKKSAAKMEKIATGYTSAARLDSLIPHTLLPLAAFGLAVWVIWPDKDQRLPLIERRDSRTCYPEPGYRPGDAVQRCMFARDVYMSQLPVEYQDKIKLQLQVDGKTWSHHDERQKITLVDWYDEDCYSLVAMHHLSSAATLTDNPRYLPIELDEFEHGLGVCPVVIGQRITLDNEPRGQFDQVVGALMAHVRLMGMVLDYADQAVYSDIWVKDLVGEMPYGGGAYIELGPNGSIGRVPPAVNSFNIQNDLQNLVDAIHVGGRWPKSRPGEIDQAIASAKFLEATAGMMNTVIKTYHLILKRMLEQALRICFLMDVKMFGGKKTAIGILRNQEFIEDYDTKDIDLKNLVRVEYGIGLGRDPAQTAVLMLQYANPANPFISKEFVQENIEGLTDVDRERRRLDVQVFEDMMKAKLSEGIMTGTIPMSALPEIIEARDGGQSLVELFKKFILEPQQQAADSAVMSGVGAAPALPPGMEDQAAALMAGPPGAGPTPPPAPEASQMMAQLGTPAGPGGLLSARSIT